MDILENNYTNSKTNEKIDEWFGELIHTIQVDHLQLKTNTASKEKKEMIGELIDGNPIKLITSMRIDSSKFFIENMVREYFSELTSRDVKFVDLALDLGKDKVLVWAVINDDDEESEDNLIMSEDKVNAKYHEYGFNITTTYVEKSDNIPVPNHYSSILK